MKHEDIGAHPTPPPPLPGPVGGSAETDRSADDGAPSVPAPVAPHPEVAAPVVMPKRHRGRSILLGLLLVVLVAAVGVVAWRIHTNRHSTTSVSHPAASPGSSENGSSSQNLDNDLKAANNSMNTETQDQQSATSTVNDQQQEISVPAN